MFRLFLARRPEEAREKCEQLAKKYRGKDSDLYKLAVLGDAWVAELVGDFEESRAILENLGNERGFETDGDRILALARIYERIGTRELLEKAVHIYQHLERSFEGSRSSATSRSSTAGSETAKGVRCEGGSCSSSVFACTARLPTSRGSWRFATSCFAALPIRFADRNGLPEPKPRERAIELFLWGHNGRGGHERVERVLDLKYGPISRSSREREEAIGLYLETWRRILTTCASWSGC